MEQCQNQNHASNCSMQTDKFCFAHSTPSLNEKQNLVQALRDSAECAEPLSPKRWRLARVDLLQPHNSTAALLHLAHPTQKKTLRCSVFWDRHSVKGSYKVTGDVRVRPLQTFDFKKRRLPTKLWAASYTTNRRSFQCHVSEAGGTDFSLCASKKW